MRGKFWLMILILIWAAGQGFAAAQATADHDDAGDHDHDGVGDARLLVGEANEPRLFVIDVEHGAMLAQFGTPGPSAIYQLPDPRYAVAVHRDDHRVTIVHSGLSAVDHGDHADLVAGNPYVLATLNVGRQPSHVFAHGNDLAFFNDQDGTVAWLDTRLLGLSLDYTEIVARRPDHGALALLDGHMVVGLPASGQLDVYARDGRSVAQFDGCPGLHGQGALATTVTFGCSDGVLIVQAIGAGLFTAHKLANPPGSAAGARVSSLAADDDSAVLIGNFGNGFALIDPLARSLATFSLPATQIAGRFYEHGELYLHLGSDGNLRSINPATGEVLAAIELVGEVVAGAVRPSLAVLGEYAYVTDPGHRAVREIELEHFEESRRFDLPFTPAGIAVLAIPGAESH